MRHISRTDIRENRLPEICLGMKLRTYWRDMVKLRVNEKNFQTMYMQEGATSDFAMESAEIIPVTVNGLDGQLFLEENWKKQQSTVTCIDISSNL